MRKIFCLNLSMLLSVACIQGCALVGPDYEQPKVSFENKFADTQLGEAIGSVSQKAWWKEYQDPFLTQLVNEGLNQNLDIALAVERIAEARATLRGKGGNQAVSGSASLTSLRSGSNTIASSTDTTKSLSGNLVIDLFGGIRREQQAAAAQLQAAIDDSATARLAYLSELVGAYIDARYYQYALKLTRQSISTREETLRITEQQHAVGNGTELEIEQVKALLFSAKADLPDLRANYLSQVYVIATLLNQPAQNFIERMQENNDTVALPGLNLNVSTDTGIPADLVRNRPDVRSAEQALIVATANVGVATADMLPSITLTGTVSDSNSQSWSFGPTINLPIFNQGRLAAQRDVAISQAKQAEITWRQSILDAMQDVQSANSAWRRDREKVDFLKRSMDAYSRSLDLSIETYEAGVTDLLDVLDTDRSLASARIQFANALRAMSVNWATLQIALGAGAEVQK